jgi:competence ComEA-like helix-hairpin-helix protein
MDIMNRLALASFSLLCLAAAQAQDLPEGKGKDTFAKICGACHDAGVVVTMHQSKDDWQSTVDDMKGRGADGSDADFKTIIEYLSKYQGPEVNVNKASADDLQKQLEITAAEAAAIVKARQDKGDFKGWEDLQKVSGVDAKKIEPLKGRIVYN